MFFFYKVPIPARGLTQTAYPMDTMRLLRKGKARRGVKLISAIAEKFLFCLLYFLFVFFYFLGACGSVVG
jgi:hypothetical protein